MGLTAHLGWSVYCWDMAQQNGALARCFAPLLLACGEEGSVCRLFFDRHGARGPHLQVLISVEPTIEAVVAKRGAALLDAFLPTLESPRLGRDEAEAIHKSIGERRFSALDRGEDLAPFNSWGCFSGDEEGWPFGLARDLSPGNREVVWHDADQLARAILRRLAAAPEDPVPAAVPALLAASFDRELETAGLNRSFWSFFAASFLPDLARRLDADADAAPLDRIEAGIGGNQPAFDRIWQAAAAGDAWPEAAALARALIAGYWECADWRLARELLHVTFKQLMASLRIELPLAFYAWRRSLREPPAER